SRTHPALLLALTPDRNLHSSPTRRSSDLPVLGLVTAAIMIGWSRSPRLRSVPASMAALLGGTALSLLPAFDQLARIPALPTGLRSEEHTSELQSRENLVCRLLLDKQNHPL